MQCLFKILKGDEYWTHLMEIAPIILCISDENEMRVLDGIGQIANVQGGNKFIFAGNRHLPKSQRKKTSLKYNYIFKLIIKGFL